MGLLRNALLSASFSTLPLVSAKSEIIADNPKIEFVTQKIIAGANSKYSAERNGINYALTSKGLGWVDSFNHNGHQYNTKYIIAPVNSNTSIGDILTISADGNLTKGLVIDKFNTTWLFSQGISKELGISKTGTYIDHISKSGVSKQIDALRRNPVLPETLFAINQETDVNFITDAIQESTSPSFILNDELLDEIIKYKVNHFLSNHPNGFQVELTGKAAYADVSYITALAKKIEGGDYTRQDIEKFVDVQIRQLMTKYTGSLDASDSILAASNLDLAIKSDGISQTGFTNSFTKIFGKKFAELHTEISEKIQAEVKNQSSIKKLPYEESQLQIKGESINLTPYVAAGIANIIIALALFSMKDPKNPRRNNDGNSLASKEDTSAAKDSNTIESLIKTAKLKIASLYDAIVGLDVTIKETFATRSNRNKRGKDQLCEPVPVPPVPLPLPAPRIDLSLFEGKKEEKKEPVPSASCCNAPCCPGIASAGVIKSGIKVSDPLKSSPRTAASIIADGKGKSIGVSRE